MSRIAYVNGQYRPHRDAMVHIEDRGYQFADGVYEVCAVMNGQLFDWDQHVERLRASLAALSIAEPMTPAALTLVARRLIAANRAQGALLYVQVTRGVARRDHPFPTNTRPSLVMTVRPFDYAQRVRQQAAGLRVVTMPDGRWSRCDVKSISLLPNVLAKQAARTAGAFEAWLVDRDGFVTEGSSTNAWIVTADGTVVTRPLSNAILPGIMRATLIRLAREAQIRIEERPFRIEEARTAAEAFLTSTTAPCVGVVAVDGEVVGGGKPGPVTRRLGELLWAEIERQTGYCPA